MAAGKPCHGSGVTSSLHCTACKLPPLFDLPKPPGPEIVSGHGLPVWLIVIIVAASLILLALMIIIPMLLIRNRSQRKGENAGIHVGDRTNIVPISATVNHDRNSGIKMENPVYIESAPVSSEQLFMEEFDSPYRTHTPSKSTAATPMTDDFPVNMDRSNRTNGSNDDAGFEQGGNGRLWRRQNWQLQSRGTSAISD
ncbi:uncharacterized protein [Ptychodera flava]|uniref:uncharacterized protein isoform X2 n=1 Tax=Ptychodera flava TaxID=63121 RepID=UPI00396A6928